MKNLIIRKEEKKDWREVEVLTRKAFWREERIEKIGVGATEHYMVHKMRENEGIEELTFVAEIENEIVGHIIYTKNSYILQPDGLKKEVLNFGPLSVLPKYQKQGIGSALMAHSIKKAKELGYGAIFFFGHPTYYPKFGFKEAKEYGITTSSGENFPAFMAMELQEGYLKGVSGKFIEAPIYEEKITKKPAKEYDEQFFKENKRVQSIVHIAIVVNDYDEAIEFYTKKLHFKLIEDTYQPEQDKRWVVISPPGSTGTTILLARASNNEQLKFVGNQSGGRIFLFLGTNNFWRDYEEMISKGIEFVRAPKEQSYGIVAVFKDLYGNLWDLVQFKENHPMFQRIN